MTEAAIDAGLARDLYVSLGEPVEHGAWTVRVHIKPFVDWIWGGCLLMALGGLLAPATGATVAGSRGATRPRRRGRCDAVRDDGMKALVLRSRSRVFVVLVGFLGVGPEAAIRAKCRRR